jgi:hypothetical protein
MKRMEKALLRCPTLRIDRLDELLPGAMEAAGKALLYEPGGDGALSTVDHLGEGCLILVDDAELAHRLALALAPRAAGKVDVFAVTGTAGSKRFRFHTQANTATALGEWKDAEGRELDLEDASQTWGGGDLEKQGERVLEEFAQVVPGSMRRRDYGYKKRPAGRPSTPRVATLLAALKKSRRHEAVPQPDGRVELRLELAAGGRQTSFCSAAEYEELQRLLAG